MMKLAPLFLLLGLFGKASAESCACVAEELGFTIDCANTDAMLEAMDYLNTNGCASACGSDGCVLNYYIVQAHHDFCPEANIPELIEDGFHDFDTACTGCDIKRDFVEGAPDCPVPNCDDGSGNAAYTSLVATGCQIDCSSDTCRDLFFTLRTVHDSCDHDALTPAAERGLHDLERPCAAQVCNQASGQSNQLVCDPHGGHGSGVYEWAGVFATAANTHQWSMQAIDGVYADPSMRLVIFSTTELDEHAIHDNEESAEVLIEGDCPIVEAGESIGGITAAGACFELHVGTGEDSFFPMDTTGIAGIAVFAQHGPLEFERDMHYFQDSEGTDVEPLAEEGGGDGHDHGHGDHGDAMGNDSGVASIAASTVTGVAALVGTVLMA